MSSNNEQPELQDLALQIGESDPSRLTDVRRLVDQLISSQQPQRASEVLQQFAERLLQIKSNLPPLARCHTFSRLGGILAGLGEWSEAQLWLSRAVALATEARLSELSQLDFQRQLERVQQAQATQSRTASIQPIANALAAANQTSATVVSATETQSGAAAINQRMQGALQRLPEEQRQLIEWRVVEAVPLDEIARRLNLPPAETLLRLAEAKAQFLLALDQVEATISSNTSYAPKSVKVAKDGNGA